MYATLDFHKILPQLLRGWKTHWTQEDTKSPHLNILDDTKSSHLNISDDTKSSSLTISTGSNEAKNQGIYMEDHIATMPIGPRKIT